MKRGMIGAIALALMLVGASAVWADYDTDRRSRDARQPAEALARWLAAAHAEDKQAMLALGRMYLHGLGAPQDDVSAYMWFTLASRDGDIKALKERDALGSRMTRGKRAEAEERARKWRPRTRSTIPRRASGQSPTEKPVAASSRPFSAQAVREAQRLLAKLGLAPGPVDGKWGKRATAAYRAFLRSEGRPSSDRLTVEGLELLRQSAADKNILAKRAPPSSGKNRIDLIRVLFRRLFDREFPGLFRATGGQISRIVRSV